MVFTKYLTLRLLPLIKYFEIWALDFADNDTFAADF